jgi:hypothetical protein
MHVFLAPGVTHDMVRLVCVKMLALYDAGRVSGVEHGA